MCFYLTAVKFLELTAFYVCLLTKDSVAITINQITQLADAAADGCLQNLKMKVKTLSLSDTSRCPM